jgi:hypothetical protein
MQGWLSGGLTSVGLTVVGLAVLAGGEALLQARGVRWYHRLGFPLPGDLGTLRRAPKGSGRGFGVAWHVVDRGRAVVFRAAGVGAPRGMHGLATLRSDHLGRVHLDVVWAPAWTPFVALSWFAVLAAARGEGLPLGGIAGGLVLVLLMVYAQVAPRVVAGLASALRDAVDQDPGGPHDGPPVDRRQGQGGRPS